MTIWGGKCLCQLRLLHPSLSLREAQARTPAGTESGTETDHGGRLLTGSLPLGPSATFLIAFAHRPTEGTTHGALGLQH